MAGVPLSRSRIDEAGVRIRHVIREGGSPSDDDLAIVEAFRAEHLPIVVALHGLVSLVQESLGRVGEPLQLSGDPHEWFRVGSRPKTTESIVAKLGRSTTRLSRMQDIAGARLVVSSLKFQDIAHEVIRSGVERAAATGVRIARTVDTRESGDELGYRAIHVVVDWAGRFGEIQLRTMWQQVWAQRVELADEIFGTDLKHGIGAREWLQWLKTVSEQMRMADLDYAERPSFTPPPNSDPHA